MRRAVPILAGAAVLAMALAVALASSFGGAVRLLFVLASAPGIGAVLLLAIGRLTGARWGAAAAWTWPNPWLIVPAAVAMLVPTAAAVPAHLAIWAHPAFVAVRAAVAMAALAVAGARLRAGAGATFAGVTLALYAWAVTPIAADWLLATAWGHPVSAVGMMLFLIQFAAGCAVGLVGAAGRTRRDLALLLVAAVIGLGYLGFVDYLIVWYGNLPARVPFYLARDGWIAAAALIAGVAGPIAAVVLRRERLAAGAAAAGLALFGGWWIGVGAGASGLAVVVVVAAGLALGVREAARG